MGTRSALFITLVSIIGAHGLTYLLLGVLPDAAVVSLGLESARTEVVAAFHASQELRTYGQVITDLALLDLGSTLDGIPVSEELGHAVSSSAPRIFLGALLIVIAALATALLIPNQGQYLGVGASFLAFLPPYVMPFIGVILVLALQIMLGISPSETTVLWISAVAISIVPAALAVAQTVNIMRSNLQSDHARTLRAVGLAAFKQRLRLLHNVAAEIVPSLEKMFTGMVAALLFAEPILGLSGFGTTAVRAVRRSDPDLLLAVTLVLAVSVGILRLLALAVRRRYGLGL
jgi:ABC-type dipeptide/oligopeptide/nickel transport system permease component